VRDSKYVTAGEEPRIFMYRPLAQAYGPRVTVVVRGRGSEADTLAALKREVAALDTGLAVFAVSSMEDAISISVLPARLAGALLGTLGVLALTLAAIGVYGVLAFVVGARTREIGLRLAVGASPARVVWMVMRQALVWTASGMILGLALASVLSRLLGTFLYGVSPNDPLTFTSVLVVLAAVAALAAWLPARRASRLDPVIALRQH
jgi:ABC-type antimicrobial peptide transport system permease subunit